MVLLMRRKDWNTYRGNNSKNGLAAQTTAQDYGFFLATPKYMVFLIPHYRRVRNICKPPSLSLSSDLIFKLKILAQYMSYHKLHQIRYMYLICQTDAFFLLDNSLVKQGSKL